MKARRLKVSRRKQQLKESMGPIMKPSTETVSILAAVAEVSVNPDDNFMSKEQAEQAIRVIGSGTVANDRQS